MGQEVFKCAMIFTVALRIRFVLVPRTAVRAACRLHAVARLRRSDDLRHHVGSFRHGHLGENHFHQVSRLR
jgi:hypothetical protein